MGTIADATKLWDRPPIAAARDWQGSADMRVIEKRLARAEACTEPPDPALSPLPPDVRRATDRLDDDDVDILENVHRPAESIPDLHEPTFCAMLSETERGALGRFRALIVAEADG